VVCRNESDAEDLVQEALLRFIQTFEKFESLPPVRDCEGWLVKTLTNLFYDQCRRRKVQADGAKDPTLSAEAVEAEPPPVESVYDTITDEQFAQSLQVLSPKVRTTFEMHAAGKKYQDIARELGIPAGTVGKRLHDARAKLREFLQRFKKPEIH
jgi:RNA polymerase sigma-70 factor (ECF subfamily)